MFVLPDYLNDLNAMHEAEKVLTRPQVERYVGCFSNIMDMEEAMRVTAKQRAEAFLRAINKWEEES